MYFCNRSSAFGSTGLLSINSLLLALFRVIRSTITLIHLFYRCNSVLPLHPSVRLRSSIILRCGVRKKTTLFLHFLCTSVRIGISYESTCFAFLYLPNPHRAFDNMLFSSPLQHSRYASFLRPLPNRTEIEKQKFPPPRSRVRNSPLTLAIAVIGEAPPQTHFFPAFGCWVTLLYFSTLLTTRDSFLFGPAMCASTLVGFRRTLHTLQ